MSYKVQQGDSPARIARRFGIPMTTLIGANPHKPTTVVANQRTWRSLRAGEAVNVPGVGVGDGNLGYTPGSITGPHSTIRRGSKGNDVATWQSFLGVTADGVFGAQTEAATRSFQTSRGLTADGVVGPNTWAAAQGAVTTQTQAAQAMYTPTSRSMAPSSPTAPHSLIKRGSSGPDVALWQTIIGVTADGVFGSGTESATIAWQKAHGLYADGIVGTNTWAAALGGAAPVAAAPVSTSSSVTSSASTALAALRADANYCASVKKSGTPVNSGVHNFKAAWNTAHPNNKVPINTGNYEPVVASALSSALGGAQVPPGCGAAAVTTPAPSAQVPSVTPVSFPTSSGSVPVAIQALSSVDPCYSGNAAMVCAAQSALGLPADGKYGAGTANALRRFFPNAPAPCSPAPLWWGHAGDNKCGGGGGVAPTLPPSVVAPAPAPATTTTSPGWQTPAPTMPPTPTYIPPGVVPPPGIPVTATSTTTITPGGPAQPAVVAPSASEPKKISTGALVAGGLGIAALVGVVAVAASSKKGHRGGGRGSHHRSAHKKHSKKRRR